MKFPAGTHVQAPAKSVLEAASGIAWFGHQWKSRTVQGIVVRADGRKTLVSWKHADHAQESSHGAAALERVPSAEGPSDFVPPPPPPPPSLPSADSPSAAPPAAASADSDADEQPDPSDPDLVETDEEEMALENAAELAEAQANAADEAPPTAGAGPTTVVAHGRTWTLQVPDAIIFDVPELPHFAEEVRFLDAVYNRAGGASAIGAHDEYEAFMTVANDLIDRILLNLADDPHAISKGEVVRFFWHFAAHRRVWGVGRQVRPVGQALDPRGPVVASRLAADGPFSHA
jgi:hypothetical protein